MIFLSTVAIMELICFIAALFIFLMSKMKKNKFKNIYFSPMCLSVMIWSLFSTLSDIVTNKVLEVTIYPFIYIGVAFFTLSSYLFVKFQINNYRMSNKKLISLSIIPLITSVFGILNFKLHLIYSVIEYKTVGNVEIFFKQYGLWFYVHSLYSYAIVLLSVMALIKIYFLIPKHLIKPIVVMGMAFVVTSVTNIVLVFANVESEFDYTLLSSVVSLYFFYFSNIFSTPTNYILSSKDFILNNLSSMILVLDDKGVIISSNINIVDYPKSLTDFKIGERFRAVFDLWILDKTINVVNDNETIVTIENDRKEEHVKFTTNDIYSLNVLSGSYIEITQITQVYSILRFLELSADFDQLTGIHNRNAYEKKLITIHKQEELPLGIIVCDVNHLKLVNDTKGHLQGDELLKTIARILTAVCPKKSFFARLGGDEYIILIPRTSPIECDQIINDINIQCEQEHSKIFGTPSIAMGYSILDNMTESLEEHIDKADKKMYINKKARKSDAM